VGAQEAPGRNVLPELNGTLRQQLTALGMSDDSHALVSDELLDLLAPALEADIAVLRGYRYGAAPPIGVPISVFVGEEDDKVDRGAIAAWALETTGEYRLMEIPGDHMFSGASWLSLARAIEASLSPPDGRPS
jgi:surfactin synthase thioesterase subunit